MQITVPAASVTFTMAPDPRHPAYIVVSLLGMPVAGMWHHGDSTGLEGLDPANPENNRPGFDFWVHGPDREKRTAEALTQLAARLFPVPV